MSKLKNEKVLDDILKENLLSLKREAIVSRMVEQEVAGQRVFYVWLKLNGYNINPSDMDKNQSDGIVGNTIIECKLNEKEGGGVKKAYQELFHIIPTRLKQKGERIPYYRIYIELETFYVEVYDCHCNLVEKFDWHKKCEKFKKYFEDKKETFEYEITDENVDLVEVIQNIYKTTGVTKKIEAYSYLQKGVPGWFKPFDIKKNNINKLILNNDKMNEKYVQKMEGAFFTPPRYIKISTKYVLNAIKLSKIKGYDDYVIIDRCAGCGNLESQFDANIYRHMILGTINEAETLTANIRFQEKAIVKTIDALSKEGVEYYINEIEKYKKKNNVKKLAVIILENPPYVQTNSNKEGGIKSKYKKTWVDEQMKNGGEDLDEQFVYSAFAYYNPFAYIHFGPIKIWKSRHLVNKEIRECYLCNKSFFNAGTSAIALIHWSNIDKQYKYIDFDNDIDKTKYRVKKVNRTISTLYEGAKDNKGICIIEARNYSFASPRMTGSINDTGEYGKKWVKEKDILKIIPLFCVSRDEYAEKGREFVEQQVDYRVIDTLYKSADGGTKYQKDREFLQDCFLWALCTHYNHCTTKCKIWRVAEKKLDKKRQQCEIWKLYSNLVAQTKINGLYNIEKFNKKEFGKLWREHNLYPQVEQLKILLADFYSRFLRPKMLKYELLK